MSKNCARGARALTVALALASVGAKENDAPPAIVALAIDSSGSLTPSDLERTKQLAKSILESLPPGSEVAIFGFDDQSRLLRPRTADAAELRRALEAITIAGRYTALYDALYDTSRYLRDAPAARKTIVLVTDGLDENSALNLDDALKVAQESSIPVFAVGVGHVQERVLRRIAKLTGGSYWRGNDASGALVAARLLEAPTAPAADSGTAGLPATTSASMAPVASAAGRALPQRSRSAVWVAAVLALVLVSSGLVLISRLRRPSARCPSCRRELASPLSNCLFCADTESPPGVTREPARTLSRVASPTMLSRMNLTEEYLEKTVTLREQPVLTVTSGPGQGMVFSLNRQSPTSLGRAKANDIVLEDVSISSEHCRIRVEEDSFVVHDLKSTNGTFVNERRVLRQNLNEGDVIKVGETYLQFRLNQKRA
jgi:hypothetical protein